MVRPYNLLCQEHDTLKIYSKHCGSRTQAPLHTKSLFHHPYGENTPYAVHKGKSDASLQLPRFRIQHLITFLNFIARTEWTGRTAANSCVTLRSVHTVHGERVRCAPVI